MTAAHAHHASALQAALELAEAGIYVVPLHVPTSIMPAL